MTVDDIVWRELLFLKQKYGFLPEYKRQHSKILDKVKYWFEKGYSLTKIKKWLRQLLIELYTPVKSAIVEIVKDQQEIIVPDTNVKLDTFKGLNLGELLSGRISTHLRNIIAQDKGVNKLKSSNVKALTGLVDTYTKAQREQAYNAINTGDNVRGWLSQALLDGRTSATCISLHNKFYPIKKRSSVPNLPPRHPNCRSIIVPVYYDDNLGDMKGENLTSWLKKNSEQAKELLGEEKFKLLVDNNLSINSFVDVKNGKYYTNEEIKSRI